MTTTVEEDQQKPVEAEREMKVLPLWDHIAELSSRLRVWLTTFLVATVFFLVAPADFSFFSNPFGFYRPFIATVLTTIKHQMLPGNNIELIAGSFTAPIMLYFVASAVFGLAVSMPVLGYEAYRFVFPGLTEKEREATLPFVLGFSALFVVGLSFGYFILTPLVIWGSLYFFGFTGASALIRVDDFYNLVFFTTLASGLTFTFPVFLVLLAKFNILRASSLTSKRRYLWPIVYVVTGLVTPDSNPISDILLFLPIIALLEAALFIAKRYEKNLPAAERSRWEILRCAYCKAPIDATGIFCGKCGRSRL